MQRAIWGTGYNGSKLVKGIDEEKVDFFIDSDKDKSGTHLGKIVRHPSEIVDWTDLFIYVPHNYYDEISGFLKRRGLQENVDFIKYDDKLRISMKKAENDFEKSIHTLEGEKSFRNTDVIFITTYLYTKKIYRDFIMELLKNGLKFYIFSEEFWIDDEEIESTFKTKGFSMAMGWEENTIVTDGVLTENERKMVEGKDYLRSAVEQICHSSDEISEESACYTVHRLYKYINRILNYVNPKTIFCYSSMSSNHYILDKVCKERNVPIIFTHQGVLPGTVAFDTKGEVGESLPAISFDIFSKLPVGDKELSQANDVWKYLYHSKLNRKIQPQLFNPSTLKKRMKKHRPVIFFAGQNDVQSRMIPYTMDVRHYHSPIFESSLSAACYLAYLCEKNDWNLIYKPHPMYTQPEQIKQLPPNVIFLEYGDINALIDMSNVVVTILSSTNYNALVRYKPVVMLGYNQTRGKGCTYEAFEKDRIEDTIKAALANGFTQEQQEAFLRHMAQCLKYYLYDDLQDRPIRYGRPVPKSIDEFYELERLLQAEDVRKEPT